MSTNEVRSSDATSKASVARVDLKLEVVVIPVSDVDRAKEFYGRLGWRLDADFRSITASGRPVHAAWLRVLGHLRHEPHVGRARFSQGVPDRFRHRGRPGRARSPPASRSARSSTSARRPGSAVRIPTIAATSRCASFKDPDGNSWLLQEITTRLPGRIEAGATSFGSASDLASALRRAGPPTASMKSASGGDPNWPDWYAAYMVAEQAGTGLPT